MRAVTRSLTLSAPVSATAILAGVARELVQSALADHPEERTISLLAVSVSHIEDQAMLQLDLPLGLADEVQRPGTVRGDRRWRADRAVDAVRERFGREAMVYGEVMKRGARSVPDGFRELAEKEL